MWYKYTGLRISNLEEIEKCPLGDMETKTIYSYNKIVTKSIFDNCNYNVLFNRYIVHT